MSSAHLPTVEPGVSTAPSKLLDQLRAHIRTRHYSIRTERAYIDWVRRFILCKKRHPRDMGAVELADFLKYLAFRLNISALTQN